MMVHLTFMLAGTEIMAEDLSHRPFGPVEMVMLRVARNHVRRRLGALSCLEHGEPPRVIASGPSAEQLTLSVEGCCQKLVREAEKALALAEDDAETALSEEGAARWTPPR
jgi:hypothetical protein